MLLYWVYIQTERRGWIKIFHANGNQKIAGVAIFTSDKIDFKIECYKRKGRTLHNDQGINPRRRYNNYKYISTSLFKNIVYETK